MSANFKVPNPKLHVRAIVRDKHGKIRCDNPESIAEILKADRMRVDNGLAPRLSEDDINDLKERFGDDICS